MGHVINTIVCDECLILFAAGPVRSTRVAQIEQGAVQLDPGKLSKSAVMSEQQRESDEQLVRCLPRPGRPDVLQDAAAGDENEVETVEEEVNVHGLGRHVATGPARHFAATDLHRGQQPRTAAQSPPLDVEETVQRHAKQLFQESTISQVSRQARSVHTTRFVALRAYDNHAVLSNYDPLVIVRARAFKSNTFT